MVPEQNRPKRRHSPSVAKGQSFAFQVSAACWVDLLGYGATISAAKYNPLRADAQAAVSRLRSFHEIITTNSNKSYPTLVLNDGAVAYRDLSLRSRSVTYEFILRSLDLFEKINDSEFREGWPGARMIVASGFRTRRKRVARDSKHLESILSRFSQRKISAEQAIREAARSRAFADVIPELQANFAFTKAYVADCDGTKAGFAGPGLYVDSLLFSCAPPWLNLGEVVSWTNERLALSGTFVSVKGKEGWQHPEGGPLEVRDGLEIAQLLSDDPEVLKALRLA